MDARAIGQKVEAAIRGVDKVNARSGNSIRMMVRSGVKRKLGWSGMRAAWYTIMEQHL